MVAADIWGIVKGVLIIAGFFGVMYMLSTFLSFVAGKLDDLWGDKTLKEINNSLAGIAVLVIVPMAALLIYISLHPSPPVTDRLQGILILAFLFISTALIFIQKEIKEMRDAHGRGVFEEETSPKTSKKRLFKIFAVVIGVIFVVLMVAGFLAGMGWKVLFLIAAYPTVLFLAYGLAILRFSGSGLLQENELEYKHHVFGSRKELNDYKNDIARDAPYIRRALKHKDFPLLLSLLDKYLKKDLLVEALAIEKEIDRIDVDRRYEKKVRELFARDNDGLEAKGGSRHVLDAQSQSLIDALELEYIEHQSGATTLALANAYRKFGLREMALMYYEELLLNFKRSPEAGMAKQAMAELHRELRGNSQAPGAGRDPLIS